MDSTNTLPQIEVAQSQKEATANELFASASPSMFAAYNPFESDGLVWAYLGGRYASSLVANGSTTLGASTTTYMVADLATGAISFSTATTDWDDSANYGRCYRIVTGASGVTSWEDHRGPGPLGIFRTADPALLGAGVELRGLRFTADAASTTDADPGAGNLRWNNADQALATVLFIDNATLDGVAINAFWGSLPSAGYLYLQQADNGTRWQLWEWTATPTDGTGYYKFTVTLRGKSTDSIADDAGIYTVFMPKSAAATIADSSVTNAKLADMATQTIKGRTTAGSGAPEDLTAAQAAAIVQGSGLDVDAAGFRGVPQNAQTGNYTTVAADAGKHIYHASGAGAGDTYTIDSNANVAYEIGTAITFVNMAADSVSIAIASDTMYLAGTGATGTRTLAQYGVATALKLTATTWVISGAGLT